MQPNNVWALNQSALESKSRVFPFLSHLETKTFATLLTCPLKPSPQHSPVVVQRYNLRHRCVKIRFVCVGVSVFIREWRSKGQGRRRDAAVLLTRSTLRGWRQRHRRRVNADQRAFVSDSESHAAPLLSEVSFGWLTQTSECEVQQLATSFF